MRAREVRQELESKSRGTVLCSSAAGKKARVVKKFGALRKPGGSQKVKMFRRVDKGLGTWPGWSEARKR